MISVESTFDGTVYKLTLKSQVFRVLPSNGDSHLSTDWEISTNKDFTNVIWSSLNNTTNKTTIVTSSLTAGIKVFVRVRHKGSVFPPSPWFVGELLVDNQQTTSWMTSFDTIYSAGPTTTLSHNTSWLTEKLTMEYGVNNRITENVTSYRTYVGGEWLNVPKTTRYLTEHVTSLSRSTSWSTGRTTSMISGVGYSDPVARTTSFETSLLQNTFRNTYTSYVGTDGSLKEESMVTSWDTAIAATTSRETSYNSVHSHNTSIVTTYPTSHVTDYQTNWTTSNDTSHYTSYTTGSTRTTSATTSWTTKTWSATKYTIETNGYYWDYQNKLNSFNNDPDILVMENWFSEGTDGGGALSGVYHISYKKAVSSTASRTTSWTTSDAQTTGHTTSYTTSYSTGQDTSWTTTYNTSQTTTWITGIRLTSKVTSNSTSNLTDV